MYGCNKIDNDYSWRIPLIIQALACVVVLFGVWFIPESPRFLMANDREEEAINFLARYHGNGDRNSKLVQLEVEEMREGIRQDGIDKRPLDCMSSPFRSVVQATCATRTNHYDRSPLYFQS